MAAINAPFGFRPSYHNSGFIRPKVYTIASGLGTNIFAGDPVKLHTDGVIQLGTSGGTRAGTVTTVKLLGIFAGVEYIDATGKPTVSNFWPSGTSATNIIAYVYDDPETLFDAVMINPVYSSTPPGVSAQASVGDEMDWIYDNSTYGGSTATGLSFASPTSGGKTDGQFQLTGFSHNIADSLTDQYIVATFRINLHHYKASVDRV